MAETSDLAFPLDAETMALEAPGNHKAELRLWLRMLTCTNLIEAEIRRRLRERFDVTLPRFDLMAQLDRAPDGMTLSQASRRMMVSNGNLTALVERLVASGHVARRTHEGDRRVQVVSLTPEGRRAFRQMAKAHEDWMAEIFAGLSAAGLDTLMASLAEVKRSARLAIAGGPDTIAEEA